jgi:hypothetical protein
MPEACFRHIDHMQIIDRNSRGREGCNVYIVTRIWWAIDCASLNASGWFRWLDAEISPAANGAFLRVYLGVLAVRFHFVET